MSNTSPLLQVAPVRTGGWAKWPQYLDNTLKMLESVLVSGRWAISGPYPGTELFEKRFAKAFADFCRTQYCVPCDHGSSALLISLEALNIGFGDEVIIPALTWIASATAVINVNAVPVLVDVDPVTLCIDPEKAEAAITPRTKAIMPVHLYSGLCDMDKLLAISAKHNIPIIEDCAHVHGAKWGNKYAGSMGKIGAFSLQQSKLLTAGEGGAVITNDETLFEKLQLLRADSRKYATNKLQVHEMELKLERKIHGTNYCLSEFQSALLLDQLSVLEKQNTLRQENVKYLFELLSEVKEIEFIKAHEKVTLRTFYCLPFRLNYQQHPYLELEKFRTLLNSLLALPIERIYPPLHKVGSYFPQSKKRFSISKEHQNNLSFDGAGYQNAEEAYSCCLTLPHWVLLGTPADMKDIATGIRTCIEILKREYEK